MSQMRNSECDVSLSTLVVDETLCHVHGVVHDFNNILQVIVWQTELLLTLAQNNDALRMRAIEIRNTADKGISLTRNLLDGYRREWVEPELLDVNQLLEQSRPFFEGLIGHAVDLQIVFGTNLLPVRFHRCQAEQIITNLLKNARDAMPRGGKLVIETAALELNQDHNEIRLGIPSGSYTTLAVIDTGEGMAAETCAHIFEPFFSTKERTKGTGIGLATVGQILKRSGGYASVESTLGLGTTFKVFLPSVTHGPSGSLVQHPRACPSSSSADHR